MTALDYVVLAVVVISAGIGATKGILKGTISLISALAGLLAAVYLYRYAASICGLFVSSGRPAEFVGFAVVFLVVMIAGGVISHRLRRRLEGTALGAMDHALGAVFGLVRGWLVCSVLYLAMMAIPFKIEAVERARLAPALIEGTRLIATWRRAM